MKLQPMVRSQVLELILDISLVKLKSKKSAMQDRARGKLQEQSWGNPLEEKQERKDSREILYQRVMKER